MNKKWNVTKLMAIASLAVLELVIELLGAGVQAISGIPLGGGLVYTITSTTFVVICLLVIDQFGAATLMRFILGILSIPLPSTGTPGFLPKVIIFIAAGIIADCLYLIFKRNIKIALIIIGSLDSLFYGCAVIWLGRLFDMPGVEVSAKLFFTPIAFIAVAIIGILSAFLGWYVFARIKNTSVVARIQSKYTNN